MPRTSWVARCATRCSAVGRRTGTWPRPPLPERTVELFPGAVYENKFGTVVVRTASSTSRSRSRRSAPTTTTPTSAGRITSSSATRSSSTLAAATSRSTRWPGAPSPGSRRRLVDPHGGQADLAARTLRTVGDPTKRFDEDALRMVRAVRLAATLDFAIEPATLAAIGSKAELVGHLSGERIAMEMTRILAAERPSIGLRLMAVTGLLAAISPDLAAQRGVAAEQGRGRGPLGSHAPSGRWREPASRHMIRLAALLHDIGKPLTMADGQFLGHETVGAGLADALLERLAVAGRSAPIASSRLVRQHMFGYQPTWSDAAVRRFIVKIGPDRSRTCSCSGRPTTWAPAANGMPGPQRAAGTGRRGTRGGRRPRPARPGHRRHGPHGRTRDGAWAGARPIARLAARARHRRPSVNDREEAARPGAHGARARRARCDRAAARSGTSPVVRPRRSRRSSSTGRSRPPTRVTRSRSWASRASRSSTPTTPAPTCSPARP